MIIVTINAENIIRSLTKLQGEFQRTSTNAVYDAAGELVTNIILKTLGPAPPPLPTKYKRTHRLVRGWGPAGEYFNRYVPALDFTSQFSPISTDEGSAHFVESEHGTYFRAENRVLYALAVELIGTWKNGKHEYRGGYNIVGSSLEEMRNEDKFPKYARQAWQLARESV